MRRLWLLACVAVLAGCGGSGGGGGKTPPDTDTVQADLHLRWGARSRAFTGPSSALSATITYLGAKPGGGDYTITVDRPAEVMEQNRTYRTTEPLEVGSTTVQVTFYAEAGGQGAVVGLAQTPAQILANGTLGDEEGDALGDIVTEGIVKSVVFPEGQRVKVDETKTLTFSARSALNEVVAVSAGSFFIAAAGTNLRVNGDGTVTGLAAGTSDVTVSIDGVQATTSVTVDPSVLQVVQTLEIRAKELVYSPLTRRVYASVSAQDPQYGGRIVAIDPINATVTGSVDVEGDPEALAIADDGRTIYVGLRDTGVIRSYDAVNGQVGLPIPLGRNRFGLNRADDIAVLPGHPKTFAVSLKAEGVRPRAQGMILFDDRTARPNTLDGTWNLNRIAWRSPALLYGYDNDTSLRGIGVVQVDAQGLSNNGIGATFLTPAATDIFVVSNHLFCSTGGVARVPDLMGIGDLPLRSTEAQAGTVDSATGRFYSLTKEEGGVGTLEVFDVATRTQLMTRTVPAFASVPSKIIAAGENHVAVTTTDGKLVLIDHARLN